MLLENEDSVIWPHSATGRFSVKSLYARLISGVPTTKFHPIWRAHRPPKIKIFLWQAFRGRLPAADQIHKHNGPSSVACVLRDAVEDTNHIFFSCVLAKMVWCCIRSWLGVTWHPTSFWKLRTLASGLSGITERMF